MFLQGGFKALPEFGVCGRCGGGGAVQGPGTSAAKGASRRPFEKSGRCEDVQVVPRGVRVHGGLFSDLVDGHWGGRATHHVKNCSPKSCQHMSVARAGTLPERNDAMQGMLYVTGHS